MEEELVIAERGAEVASKVFKSMVREAISKDHSYKERRAKEGGNFDWEGDEGGRGWDDFIYGT
jgi:hypothetical protein